MNRTKRKPNYTNDQLAFENLTNKKPKSNQNLNRRKMKINLKTFITIVETNLK